jgi:hypothetical protein
MPEVTSAADVGFSFPGVVDDDEEVADARRARSDPQRPRFGRPLLTGRPRW